MESPVHTEKEDRLSENQNKEPEKGGVTTVNDTQTKRYTTTTTIEIIEENYNSKEGDDLVILRKHPATNRNQINKTAYAKLHRTSSPTRNNNAIDTLKVKYETNNKPDLIDLNSEINKDGKTEQSSEEKDVEQNHKPKRTSPVKLDEETVQSLKNKYSPASFGYPKVPAKNSKLPIPKPRSAVRSQIILPSNRHDKSKLRYSLDVGKKPNSKDENSNEVYRKNSSSSGEFISIVTRSESEASVDKLERELNLFMMDGKPKEKKRNSGFKKIFSGRIFGKDKKKKEEEKNKLQHKENATRSDNLQNETNAFSRQPAYRHTVGGSGSIKPIEAKVTRSVSEKYAQPRKVYITKEMEEKYAQMHINQFNHIKRAFEHTNSPNQPNQGYVRMDKPIAKNNPGPTNYMNLPNVKKYIDTSSSASTLESDKSSMYQNTSKEQLLRDELNQTLTTIASAKFNNENKDVSRDTPPRAQELRQDVRLVNPKALIPINSERPLPNPYQSGNHLSSDSPTPSATDNTEIIRSRPQAHFEETYGTVVDSIEYVRGKSGVIQRPSSNMNDLRGLQKPPRSPSLESTKLKLPTNREIVPLSPRIKSPIPHDHVSTEKIIATELLKTTRSPPPTRKSNTKLSSPSHQKLEIDIDYPDNINNERNEKSIETNNSLSSKPPISKIPFRSSSLTKQPPVFDNKRLSETSPSSENLENIYTKYRISQASPVGDNQEKITINAMVHVNSPKARTPTPNNMLHNRSLSPRRPSSARSSTPVNVRASPTAKASPQKEDMRKSVEAYYWKEIKKLKEQENYDLYMYQMQMMPYGYAEDPISVRRSRSLSPISHRNSRRSLSLPRDTRSTNVTKDIAENPYGRMQQEPIPEGRAVVNQQVPQRNVTYGQLQEYQPIFRRNAPERRTIEGTPSSYDRYNGLYKPIFKRGSLSTPVREYPEDLQNKKVSFSGSEADTQSLQSWPTKNGFTQSPPQRRIDSNRNNSLEDDVFVPNAPRSTMYDGNEIYGYTNKPTNLLYEYRPNLNENAYQRSRQNQEPLYSSNPTVRYRHIKSEEYRQPQEEYPYGQTTDTVVPRGLTRHGSIQMQEPLYEQRQIVARRMSYDNPPVNVVVQRRIQEPQYVNRQQVPSQVDPRYGYKREIIVTDEIFGQFGGYIPENIDEKTYFQNRQLQNPVYSSRQSVTEPVYGRSGPKQVSVTNKVCDMYGQIHDRDSPSLTSPSHVQKTGVILGELQSNQGSPRLVRQSYTQLPNEHFARNTRLTASVNDMYRRHQGSDPRYRNESARYPYQDTGAPTRPLPPVPMEKKVILRNNSGRADAGSASEASETQRVMSSGAKNKKRSFFGK